jgi:hypothetical protein
MCLLPRKASGVTPLQDLYPAVSSSDWADGGFRILNACLPSAKTIPVTGESAIDPPLAGFLGSDVGTGDRCHGILSVYFFFTGEGHQVTELQAFICYNVAIMTGAEKSKDDHNDVVVQLKERVGYAHVGGAYQQVWRFQTSSHSKSPVLINR